MKVSPDFWEFHPPLGGGGSGAGPPARGGGGGGPPGNPGGGGGQPGIPGGGGGGGAPAIPKGGGGGGGTPIRGGGGGIEQPGNGGGGGAAQPGMGGGGGATNSIKGGGGGAEKHGIGGGGGAVITGRSGGGVGIEEGGEVGADRGGEHGGGEVTVLFGTDRTSISSVEVSVCVSCATDRQSVCIATVVRIFSVCASAFNCAILVSIIPFLLSLIILSQLLVSDLFSSIGELKSVIVFVVRAWISMSVLYFSTSCLSLFISSSNDNISTSLAEFLNSVLDLNSMVEFNILYLSRLFNILSSSSSKSNFSLFSSV